MLRVNTSPLFSIPDVRVEAVVDDDVVRRDAVEALAELEAAVQAAGCCNLVVRRAVVEVDVPAVVAAPAVVAEDGWVAPCRGAAGSGSAATSLSTTPHVGLPEAVAAPGVEAAVVAGFQHGVEDVAELDEVAAPAAVADVDAGARHVVDRAMAHGDALRHARSARPRSASRPGRCA